MSKTEGGDYIIRPTIIIVGFPYQNTYNAVVCNFKS